MAVSEQKKKEYIKRLLLARMRILSTHGFYGLLLMHAKYALDDGCDTAYTDGEVIAFSPKFMDELSDKELDFVLMHEVMHIVLRHCFRGAQLQHRRYNIASDIVVNSNILKSCNMQLSSITLRKYGESMHIAPDKKEGYNYTAEQVYKMLPEMPEDKSGNTSSNTNGSGKGKGKGKASGNGDIEDGEIGNQTSTWDDHTKWGKFEEDEELHDLWVRRFEDACKSIEIRESIAARGLMPLFAKRFWEDRKKPQTDWRTVLQDFIQQDVYDYSFSPPDRRFDDSPFFLPDYNSNEKEDVAKDVLFMVDTSGSISDNMLAAAYAEVKGAIDQFDGVLEGWVGFFDAAIIQPVPFSTLEDFKKIKAAGGGGTSFHIIFQYIKEYMQEKPPACVIILTDGGAPFPKQEMADDIPVLWLLNNEEVKPPWGRVARIKVE